MNKIIVIAGPTAVGKTKLSIEIAKDINGEIISSDSCQIYKGMDIGTSKVLIEETEGIKHHLIDIVNPDCEFTVTQYGEMARNTVDSLIKLKKVPIVTGGTGFYINSLIYDYSYAAPKNEEIRDKYSKILEEKGTDYLFEILKECDYESSLKIHKNNTKRVIRAIEVTKSSGQKFSSFQNEEMKDRYDTKYFVINRERENLYNQINKRVEKMVEMGLFDEVSSLLDKGYDDSLNSMQAIGYKEVISCIKGDISKEKSIDLIKQHSRNYAKRQLVWFKAVKNAIFLNADELSVFDMKKIIINEYNK